jgi:DNA-binding PadR family transcriptional regulator
MARVFGHGGLRLVLLSLLEDEPRYGYELIVALEERFMGMYRPSSGTVYPRLAALEEEGMIESEEIDGKRVYRITDAGRAELNRRRSELEDAVSSATTTVRAVMNDLQTDIRSAVSAVQTEIRRQARGSDDVRHAADDIRQAARDAWRSSEDARRVAIDEAKRIRRMADDLRRQATREARAAAGARSETRHEVDDLVREVKTFATDAAEQLRRYLPDDDQRARLRRALADAQRAFMDTLSGDQGSR